MKIAPVNRIIPSSLVDGPGNRTSIFLQGCNIACAYCHNPETQRLCNSCGTCVGGCPSGALKIEADSVIWDSAKCTLCDNCIKICPNFSSPRVRKMSAEEVFQEVEKNIPFIRGITVSGGECTLYPDFIEELFSMAKEKGLSCLIDSNGMADFTLFPKLINLCDGVMLDVKSWDGQVYNNLTGADNFIVKNNLCHLAECNKLEEVRVVCLKGEVDAEEVIKGIRSVLGEKVANLKLKLIKFRCYGTKGRLENTPSPDDVYMQELLELAMELGFKNTIII